MSTRSTIGIIRKDGTKTGIYCHWDGYIEHNGAILNEFYNTAEKVEELLKLGDLSYLGEKIAPTEIIPHLWDWANDFNPETRKKVEDYCVPYTARGEQFQQTCIENQEFVYMFNEKTGRWYVSQYGGRRYLLKNKLTKLAMI